MIDEAVAISLLQQLDDEISNASWGLIDRDADAISSALDDATQLVTQLRFWILEEAGNEASAPPIQPAPEPKPTKKSK